MAFMFKDAESFNQDIRGWDVSSIVDSVESFGEGFTGMFDGATAMLNRYPQLSTVQDKASVIYVIYG